MPKYRHDRRDPTDRSVVLHAKHMSIDDDIAVIRSSNLDMRSLTLNLEVTLAVYDPRVVGALR